MDRHGKLELFFLPMLLLFFFLIIFLHLFLCTNNSFIHSFLFHVNFYKTSILKYFMGISIFNISFQVWLWQDLQIRRALQCINIFKPSILLHNQYFCRDTFCKIFPRPRLASAADRARRTNIITLKSEAGGDMNYAINYHK